MSQMPVRFITAFPDLAWQNTWPRSLVILGSTGSIGASALDVIGRQPELFTVQALAGGKNIQLLATQAAKLRPQWVGLLDAADLPLFKKLLPRGYSPTIVSGQEGFETLASLPEASTVLSAQVGAAGLRGTYAAAKAGKVIALANKESLVLAGHLLRRIAQKSGAVILPVDSEHNALFQCLVPNNLDAVSRLILTASGGPFRDYAEKDFASITQEQALSHPNWSMGAKITIDSATLMNKGLELIEACHLFGIEPERVDIVVHKESIIHSLVEYADGSQLAQLGQPDMRIAIAYALGYPKRLETGVEKLHLQGGTTLSFTEPNEKLFPCLTLARMAWKSGNGAPVVLNAANEIAVAAFLQQRIHFTAIPRVVELCLQDYEVKTSHSEPETLEDILTIDMLARKTATSLLTTCAQPHAYCA